MHELITVNFDGGSRGNPGNAGIGVVLSAVDGTSLITLGRFIGKATNNVAEYMALITGLREAQQLGAKKVLVRGDSELIIKQMNGEYRVKNAALRDLHEQAMQLTRGFTQIKFEHNLRHHNSVADRLANLAMDRQADVTDIDPEPIVPPAVPAAKSNRRSCPLCGAMIEIKTPPTIRAKGSHFICPCGGTMS